MVSEKVISHRVAFQKVSLHKEYGYLHRKPQFQKKGSQADYCPPETRP